MSKSTQASYVLVIRAMPDPDDVDGIRRLRRLLKSLVRGYRFQPVSINPVKDTTTSDQPATNAKPMAATTCDDTTEGDRTQVYEA